MSLMSKLKKAGSIVDAQILSESNYFKMKDVAKTDIPIVNLAFSGDLDGGVVSGLTVFAGESKSFKTLLGLNCIKAYLNKYEDGVCLLYDSEFGITPKYLEDNGIDTNRVLHIPIEHVEQLKFDLTKRLSEIEDGDKVFIMVDSLGSLASKKEVDDAIDEKSVADMSRAKAIRSLLRIVTPVLTMKNIPMIVINHVYKEIGMFPKTVIPGGTAVTYSANQIFVITKAQDKEGTELKGWNFTITIDKSRFVREKSKFTFNVRYDTGINLFSGIFDLAVELGVIESPTKGFYTLEGDEKKYRRKELEGDESVMSNIVESDKFKQLVESKFKL
jgi:RecA/RadA recombinase